MSRIHFINRKGDGKIRKLTRLIGIEGDLTDEQRPRMLEIADKCPVHKTLESKITIKRRLQETRPFHNENDRGVP